jgi:hypothetical protein
MHEAGAAVSDKRQSCFLQKICVRFCVGDQQPLQDLVSRVSTGSTVTLHCAVFWQSGITLTSHSLACVGRDA